MSNPKSSLQSVTSVPEAVATVARTRAYNECGEPVIHGRASGGATTGDLRSDALKNTALSRNVLLVESWNW
jgi:hypothetical protein